MLKNYSTFMGQNISKSGFISVVFTKSTLQVLDLVQMQ